MTRTTKYVGGQEALRRRSLAMGAGRADHDYASEFAVFNPRELSSIGTGIWAAIVVSPARLQVPLLQHIRLSLQGTARLRTNEIMQNLADA